MNKPQAFLARRLQTYESTKEKLDHGPIVYTTTHKIGVAHEGALGRFLLQVPKAGMPRSPYLGTVSNVVETRR